MDRFDRHISETDDSKVICASDDDCVDSEVCRERRQVSPKKPLSHLNEIGKNVLYLATMT